MRGGGGAGAKDAMLMLVGVSNLLERIRDAKWPFVLDRKFWNDGDLAKNGSGGGGGSSTMDALRGTARAGARPRLGGRLARFTAEFRGVNTSPLGKQ